MLRTLGGLELVASSFTRPKPLLLLCYLALEGPKERRYLAELFWQEATDPHNRLAVTLARLRRAEPASVGADSARVWTDLSTDAQALLAAVEGGRFKEAVGLYRGSFLEGLYFDSWGDELSEWVYGTRDFLVGCVKTAQLALAEAEAAAGRFENAAKCAEAALAVAQTAGLEPSDISRLYILLLAGNNPRAGKLCEEAETFGVQLVATSAEARDVLRQTALHRDTPNNLLRRGNTFVGRDLELAEVAALLSREDRRLVTVVGPAGVGKTRLALEAARQALRLERFKDGIYFVPLDALTTPSSIPASLAGALGLALQGQGDPLKQIARHLGDQRLLLVLDNFEHLLAGAILTSELLQSCPNLALLTTSRERLNLEEEWVFSVAGLAYPEAATHPPEESRFFDAPQLFWQRAKQAYPDFDANGSELPGVLELCRLVDGLPLGLELAATWVKVMPLEDIAQEIKSSLDILTTPTRNLPDRHKSIKAAFAHSWELLTAKEQKVLRRLAVFQGGFRREAASKVAGATISLLASLVDKSMLRAGYDGRYSFHPLLQQYTQEKLDANPYERQKTHEKHAAYFCTLAEQAGPQLRSAAQTDWLGRLEAELGNLRAALNWTETHGQARSGLQLASVLGEFCQIHGYLGEGRTLLRRALAQPGATERTKVRAQALNCAGALAWMQGDTVLACPLYEESLAISRHLGDQEKIAGSLHYLGRAKIEQGDYTLARSFYEESLAIDRALGNEFGVANTLHGLGWVVIGQGDLSLARSLYEESLAIGEKLGNQLRISDALHGLGHVITYQGDLPLARSFFEQSLAISRKLGDKWNIVNTLNKLGLLVTEQGDLSFARSLLTESMTLAQEMEDRWGMIFTLEAFASLAAASGDLGQTVRFWSVAEVLRERLGSPLPLNEYARREHDLALARSQLGETAFRAEWAEGRTLSQERAITDALAPGRRQGLSRD